jgi:hypothetical protein
MLDDLNTDSTPCSVESHSSWIPTHSDRYYQIHIDAPWATSPISLIKINRRRHWAFIFHTTGVITISGLRPPSWFSATGLILCCWMIFQCVGRPPENRNRRRDCVFIFHRTGVITTSGLRPPSWFSETGSHFVLSVDISVCRASSRKSKSPSRLRFYLS